MAQKLKAEVSRGFVPAAEQQVIQSLQQGDELIEHMLSKVDAEKSQATVESDRLMILELIQSQKNGVSKFNQFVRGKVCGFTSASGIDNSAKRRRGRSCCFARSNGCDKKSLP